MASPGAALADVGRPAAADRRRLPAARRRGSPAAGARGGGRAARAGPDAPGGPARRGDRRARRGLPGRLLRGGPAGGRRGRHAGRPRRRPAARRRGHRRVRRVGCRRRARWWRSGWRWSGSCSWSGRRTPPVRATAAGAAARPRGGRGVRDDDRAEPPPRARSGPVAADGDRVHARRNPAPAGRRGGRSGRSALPGDAEGWVLLAYLAVVPTAAAYSAYFTGLRGVPATTAALLALLEPLTATIGAVAAARRAAGRRRRASAPSCWALRWSFFAHAAQARLRWTRPAVRPVTQPLRRRARPEREHVGSSACQRSSRRSCASVKAGSSRSCRASPSRSTPWRTASSRCPTPSCARRPTGSARASPTGESLDDLLAEAFAAVREAARRTLGQRHFDVQLMGGAALHLGNIAEMKTGEGKTLVATAPAYLNALTGKGVHVVTVNDYLASYQAELMGRVYRFLGLTSGVILSAQRPGRAPRAVRRATSPTAPTTSSASTTCATTWRGAPTSSSSAATTSRSSTRSTRSSSTRRARR